MLTKDSSSRYYFESLRRKKIRLIFTISLILFISLGPLTLSLPQFTWLLGAASKEKEEKIENWREEKNVDFFSLQPDTCHSRTVWASVSL